MKARDSIYNVGNDYPQFVSIYYNPTPVPPEPTPPEPSAISGNLIYSENGNSANLTDGFGNELIYVENSG